MEDTELGRAVRADVQREFHEVMLRSMERTLFSVFLGTRQGQGRQSPGELCEDFTGT